MRYGFLPLSQLEDPIALCIDLKTEYRQVACKGQFKTFAIPGLDFEDTFLVKGGVPPMSYLVRYHDFLLHGGKSDRFAPKGRVHPIAIQPPFRNQPVGRKFKV